MVIDHVGMVYNIFPQLWISHMDYYRYNRCGLSTDGLLYGLYGLSVYTDSTLSGLIYGKNYMDYYIFFCRLLLSI